MKVPPVILLVLLAAAVYCDAGLIRTARSHAAGTSVTVSGLVTVPTGQFGDGGFAIQDFSGGIYISAPSTGSNPSVTVGKAVEVTGVVNVVNDLIYIIPTTVSVAPAAEPDYACPSLAGDVGVSNQGRLLAVSGQVVSAVVAERNGKKFTLTDSSANLQVFVPSSTGIDLSTITSGYVLRIIGLSSSYNNVPEIVPRFASDFLIVSAAPAPSPTPSASPSSVPSPSASPSSTPSATPSPSPSASPSRSPTPSSTPSATPSPSPTASPSASPSRSPTPSPSASPSSVPSATPSPSPSPSIPSSSSLAAIYGVEETVGAGSGPTLYVATTGSDTAAGTISAPLKTVATAVSKVTPGGTIILRAGTYQGAVINTGYGNSTAWVTLKAYDGEAVVLQGNPRGTSVATIYFYHSTCDEYAPAGSVCVSAYWRIIGLKIMGDPAGGSDSNAVKIDTPHVQVINCTLCCTVPDVVKIVRTANDAVVMGSEIFANPSVVQYGANAQGVDITGADRVLVLGNYFHDLPDIAAYAKGNARNAIFGHNRITRTGYGGSDLGYNAIMLGQQTDENRLVDGPYESYDGLVINNIITDVTGACLAASSSYNPRFYHNTCYRTSQTIHAAMLVSTEGGLSYTPNKGAEFVNNIFVQNSTRPRILRSTDREYTKPTEAPLIIQNNIYWASGATPTFLWIPDFYNDKYFSDWQTTYGRIYNQTDTSRIVDPLLTTDLKLGASSPAIATARAGLALVDFNLKPRPAQPSLGAFEP